MIIRRMTADDITDVQLLLLELWEESEDYQWFTRSWDYTSGSLAAMLAPNSPFCPLVAEVDYNVIGICFGLATCTWFAPDRCMNELVLAVRKSHRGTLAGPRLVKALENEASAMKCKAVLAGTSLGIDDALVERLYTKLGYSKFGHGFKKDLLYSCATQLH